MDIVTYAAAVGAAKKYTDEQGGGGSSDAVKYTEQTLTSAQQAQARTNIGAASVDSVPTSLAELSDDSTHRLVTDAEKTTWNGMVPSSTKGASNGVAELDSNGKVPSSQLPSFVDDVIEGYYSALNDRFYEESTFTTLIEPTAGKSWVDIPANKSYRWTGSVYTRVDEGVQIGETSDTAYAGNKGKANADAIAAINEVIPSTATSQNPLATADDIPTDAVKYTEQSLTDAQKTQARTNIGAGTSNFSGNYDDLDNAPDMTFIQPEISDMVDSGLGWRAKQAYYTDTAGNPQYYAQCLSYSDEYNGGYSLKINNGPSICAFIRDQNLIWGVYLLSTVESAAVINYAESRSSPVETISPVASNSWYIAGRIINIGDYDPGKKRNYPDIVLPADSTFRNADFGTDAATRAEAVRIILEAAYAIPPTSFNVPTVECTEQRYANAVKYIAQTLTDAQKTQARTNIGVVQPDWRVNNSSNTDYIKNKPPILAVYPGTSGSLTGGTGMSSMNEATKQNSIAYGYVVSAKGNYSAAFGHFLQALHDYEIAYGKFNQSNADTVFSIGDGTDTQNRHNLMELKTDGTLLLNGNAVKTEGGDDDNKLRLGQVFDLSNTNPYGIYNYNYGYGLKIVEFSSVEVRNNVSNAKQVGDFVLYMTGTSPSTDKIMFAPIAGRTSGKTLTGAWVKAEYLYELFNNCSALISIDLSPVDTSAVRDMTRMFYKCTSLTTLDLSSFDMSNVIEYTDMFTNDTALTTLKCPKINPHDDIPLPRTLYSQDGTAYTNLPVTTGTSIELRQSWT